ncbi:MAG: hypothetical protein M1828_002330 [Chrysothrix sp. TS-e1954]|nr:MAG: hypothetical protein M1828_002330 [Chrysothrix sp. TS-e1954]
MAFNFNFSGDDIDQPEALPPQSPSTTTRSQAHEDGNTPAEVEVESHDPRELLLTLPRRIAFNTSLVSTPQHDQHILIPRRALFDVRLQIMAESPLFENHPSKAGKGNKSSSSHPSNGAKTSCGTKDLPTRPMQDCAEGAHNIGLGDFDIERNVYEGGFKSWEGAMDLARILLERRSSRDVNELTKVHEVVELGCGTALPSLLLLQHALQEELPMSFTLCDYNASVLRLVTLPNLLLVWALENFPSKFLEAPKLIYTNSHATDKISGVPRIQDAEGDLEVSTDLIDAFLMDLSKRSMNLSILSGPWSRTLSSHITPALQQSQGLLVLAAETIYNPASLKAFTELLLSLLKTVAHGKGLVAAKRVYFGVGGSVDAFREGIIEGGGIVEEVQTSRVNGCNQSLAVARKSEDSSGVGRCLLEVHMT